MIVNRIQTQVSSFMAHHLLRWHPAEPLLREEYSLVPVSSQALVGRRGLWRSAQYARGEGCRFTSSRLGRAWCSRSRPCASSARARASASTPRTAAKAAAVPRSSERRRLSRCTWRKVRQRSPSTPGWQKCISGVDCGTRRLGVRGGSHCAAAVKTPLVCAIGSSDPKQLLKVFRCSGSHLTLILVNCPPLQFSDHPLESFANDFCHALANVFCPAFPMRAHVCLHSCAFLFSTHFPSVAADYPKSSTFPLLLILPGGIILRAFPLLAIPLIILCLSNPENIF